LYWVVDEIEAGGGKPQLVNARLAKLMMGMVNKSDKLDAQYQNTMPIRRGNGRKADPSLWRSG
jgi:hypothetical protein